MSLKTIKVNPIFLAADNAGFSAKNKTRKEKPSGISLGQSNNIKKKLIARIKNFQQNSQANGGGAGANGGAGGAGAGAGANVSMPESIQTDVFSDSVQFLDNLARDKEEKKREKKNTTLKKKQPPNPEAYMNIATELPPELNWNTILPSTMPNAYVPNAMPTTSAPTTFAPTTFAPTAFAPTTFAPTLSMPMLAAPTLAAPTTSAPSAVQWQAAPQPSYSNLKTGGTRPTYRTWLRTTQKQKPIVKPTINILEDIAPINTPLIEPIHTHAISMPEALPVPVSTALMPTALMPTAIVPTALSETTALSAPTTFAPTALVPPYTPSLKPRRKRITKTLKYKLGKHANGKVSVLIKNSQTRRKVQTEQALLKQKSILDIKNHLRSNNLLKVGSNAPSDVLRHLYEQSILAGQVENKAKDTLIHNFFNEEKK